jgi:transcriptional regulator with XRE-family HTH domain
MPPRNPYESFIQELKAVRLARGLTQAQLAEKINLSRAQYTAIECGRSTANFRHMYNLAVALKTQWVIGTTKAA